MNRALRELVGALDGVSGRSDAIATAATFLDQPGYINEIFGRVRSVTPEAMVQVAKEWFVPERRSILYVLPETSEGDGS